MIVMDLFSLEQSVYVDGAVRIAYNDNLCPTFRIDVSGIKMMLEKVIVDGVDLI